MRPTPQRFGQYTGSFRPSTPPASATRLSDMFASRPGTPRLNYSQGSGSDCSTDSNDSNRSDGSGMSHSDISWSCDSSPSEAERMDHTERILGIYSWDESRDCPSVPADNISIFSVSDRLEAMCMCLDRDNHIQDFSREGIPGTLIDRYRASQELARSMVSSYQGQSSVSNNSRPSFRPSTPPPVWRPPTRPSVGFTSGFQSSPAGYRPAARVHTHTRTSGTNQWSRPAVSESCSSGDAVVDAFREFSQQLSSFLSRHSSCSAAAPTTNIVSIPAQPSVGFQYHSGSERPLSSFGGGYTSDAGSERLGYWLEGVPNSPKSSSNLTTANLAALNRELEAVSYR